MVAENLRRCDTGVGGQVLDGHRLLRGQGQVAPRPGGQLARHGRAQGVLSPSHAGAQDELGLPGIELGQPDQRCFQGAGHGQHRVLHQLGGLDPGQSPLAELGHRRLLNGPGPQIGLGPAPLRQLGGRRRVELAVVYGQGGAVGQLLDVGGVSGVVRAPGPEADDHAQLAAPHDEGGGDQAGDPDVAYVGGRSGPEHGLDLRQHGWRGVDVRAPRPRFHHRRQGRRPVLPFAGVGVVQRDVGRAGGLTAGLFEQFEQVENAGVAQGLGGAAHDQGSHAAEVGDDPCQLARQLGHCGHPRRLTPEGLVPGEVRGRRIQRLRSAHRVPRLLLPVGDHPNGRRPSLPPSSDGT